jgi:hypothetical protein
LWPNDENIRKSVPYISVHLGINLRRDQACQALSVEPRVLFCQLIPELDATLVVEALEQRLLHRLGVLVYAATGSSRASLGQKFWVSGGVCHQPLLIGYKLVPYRDYITEPQVNRQRNTLFTSLTLERRPIKDPSTDTLQPVVDCGAETGNLENSVMGFLGA